ncbi:MAG: prepilin-type N-terminal cleavage/methylation domain-containing protein, partial [Polyangiaceae bacterium]|nr:prepilin-type N-terminal cleavage/methylation domain-containing protein [Polyangiaceae bacterium]
MRPSRKKGGFTLVELMAALVAGLVAITAIYAVGSSSARHFQEQQRIAQTQMALRMAMSQLRVDIQRAGLFGT